MSNLNFKYGKWEKLPAALSEGTIYVTTDEKAMYVDLPVDGTTQRLRLGDIIVKESARTAKPPFTMDAFYYFTKENALLRWNGTSWTQLNTSVEDTNDDTYVDEITVSDASVDKEKGTVTYTFTVKQNTADVAGTETPINDVTFDLVLTKEDVANIIHNPSSVGLITSSENITNSVKLMTNGEGSNGASAVTIIGGDNVSISANASEITISAVDTTYALETAAGDSDNEAKVLFTDSVDGDTESAIFKAGSDLVVSGDTDGITYSHKEIKCTPTAKNKESLSPEGDFSAVTGITVENGHITAIETTPYQLPPDTVISEITGDKDWKRTIADSNGGTFDINFSSEAQELEEALIARIDDGLAAANTALTYKGTISLYNDLLTKTGVEVGDVWLLGADDGTYKTGDLFIATAGKDAVVNNGVISKKEDATAENPEVVVWTYVPSGDDLNTDTLFYGDVTITEATKQSNGAISFAVKAQERADGSIPTVADNETLQIQGGTDILINANGTNAVINHKTYDLETEEEESEGYTSFTAVTGATVDNGHVTGVTFTTFTPDQYELTTGTNAIVLKETGSNSDRGSIPVIGDDHISTTVSSAGVQVGHKTHHTGDQVVTATSSDQNLDYDSSFNIISELQYDDAGHITSASTKKITLPGSYSFEASGNTNPQLILKDGNGDTDIVTISGDGGSLAVANANNVVTIGMVWGTFN